MFSFTYLIINIASGFVAGVFANSNSTVGYLIVAGAVAFTWFNFTFGWAIITFIEVMLGITIYESTASTEEHF